MSNQNAQQVDAAQPAVVGYDASSEQTLVSACLRPEMDAAVSKCHLAVSHADFVHPMHAIVWRIKSSLMAASLPCDFASILALAAKEGADIDVAYLTQLAASPVYTGLSERSLTDAARRIFDGSCRRRVDDVARLVASQSPGALTSTDELMRLMEDTIVDIRRKRDNGSTGPQWMGNAIVVAIEQIEERYKARESGEEATFGVPTGSRGLDAITGGLQDGDLIILAGRPSMGKTARALHLARAAAQSQQKRKVLFFSTEQSINALALRQLASSSRIDATALRSGELDDQGWGRLIESSAALAEEQIYVDDTSFITLPEIRARARSFKQEHAGSKILIVIDYLQRISSHHEGQYDKVAFVGECSRGLKDLAKELGCPVVALAQVGRGVEQRTSKRPMMSDLAESGKIEQDADVIIFLYRDEYYHPDTKEPGIIEEITAKQRDGAIGTSKMAFTRQYVRFDDIHTEYS